MSFLSRVLQFLFWLLVLSWSVKLLRRVVAWVLRGSATPAPAPPQGADVAGTSEAVGTARRLVRDPVCGVHVAEVLSIPLREGGETLHFCSVACRDQYASSVSAKKIAAHG
jgi:YHS domain-containing protein